MIKKLSIRNFKSVKNLQFDCRRVNLFIGEPNVGKSNILESFALPAFQGTLSFEGLARFNDLSNLFYQNDPSNEIEVTLDSYKSLLVYDKGLVQLRFDRGNGDRRNMEGSFSKFPNSPQGPIWDLGIHPYFYKPLRNFSNLQFDFLSVPHGDNLFSMLQTKRNFRALASSLVQDRGFKLLWRQEKYELEISREEDSILISHPYAVTSDTLQRMVFFLAAIETNREDSTLIFEEPESNVFPYYTKFLAEKIALDTQKQFFMTTHNPYFLQSIIEKTPIGDLCICLTKMENFSTVIHPLTEKGIEEVLNLSSDVFLNFNRLLEL